MSEKMKQQSLEVRGRAVGMIEADMRYHDVAKDIEVPLRTIERWWAQYKKTGSVLKGKSSSRPKVFGRVEKIIITKSNGKKWQSPRKSASKFSRRNLIGSKDTIQ